MGEVLAPRPMLLSAHHLGWKGGSNGSAVVLPASCAIGDTAPSEKWVALFIYILSMFMF